MLEKLVHSRASKRCAEGKLREVQLTLRNKPECTMGVLKPEICFSEPPVSQLLKTEQNKTEVPHEAVNSVILQVFIRITPAA